MNNAIHRFAMLSFAFLLGPVSMMAQKPAEPSVLYVLPAPAAQECPVSIHAQQRAGGGTLMTRDGQRHPFAQRIHLILGDFKNPGRVVSARVTVRGTNGKPRAVPTTILPDGQGEATKTLDLRFDIADNGETSTDLSLAGFTSVSSIRLDSLTFADGSIWTSFDGKSCRTTPDPFMLVGSR